MKTALPILSLLACAVVARAASFQPYRAADVVLGQADFTGSQVVVGQPDRFYAPVGVACDPSTGKVFISDAGNHRVLRFSSAAAAQSGANPEMVIGQPNFTAHFANQGGMPAGNTLNTPYSLTVDARGRLWVADLYNHRVLGYYLASYLSNNPVADIVLGQPDASTATDAAARDKMRNPSSVAVGPDDSLWVADSGNNRVLRFDAITSKSTGAAADGLLGQFGWVTSGHATSAAGMWFPIDLQADAAGRLWVADSLNNRVLRFDDAVAKSGQSNPKADGVLGQPGFTSLGAALDAAHVNYCSGIYLDAAGTLWVSDNTRYRIVGFPAAATLRNNAPPATFVIGQPDLVTGKEPAAASAEVMKYPAQIAGGPGGSLYVVDASFNRVLRFSPIPEVTPTPTPQPAAPVVKITGAKKLTTAKAKVTIRGKATGQVTSITAKLGKKTVKARGLASWSLKAPLKPGRNTLTIIAHGPGGASKPAKITILRRP